MKNISLSITTENVTVEVTIEETYAHLKATISNASIAQLVAKCSVNIRDIRSEMSMVANHAFRGQNHQAVSLVLDLIARRRDYLRVEHGVVTLTDMTTPTPAVFSVEIGE